MSYSARRLREFERKIALMHQCREDALRLAGGPEAVKDGQPVTTAVTMYRVWCQAISIMEGNRK